MTAWRRNTIGVRGAGLAWAVLVTAVCVWGGGCGAMKYFTYLATPEPAGKKVAAEFSELAGHRVAIVIFTDERVQYEYPRARLTLGSVIRAELIARLKEVSVTDPVKVCRFQDEHTHWDTMAKSELARQFGVDYILFISLMEYSTREVGSLDLYRGRIAAECSVYRAGMSDNEGRAWRCDRIAVAYPKADPSGVPGDSDRTVREAAEQMLADALVKKFYDHKVPIER